jgi:competence protein ComFC
MDLFQLWCTIKRASLDLLFPPTERSLYIRKLDSEIIKQLPRAKTMQTDYLRAVFDYQDKTIQALVQAAKYDGNRKAARIMGRQMYDEILFFCQERRIISQHIGLVPIPLSKERLRKRGFNQCRRIIKSVCTTAKQTDHLQERHVLRKVKQTRPQTNMGKRKRKENVKNCFRLKSECNIEEENLIIIDDVTTTGATIAEAKRALAAGNPESISALTFAH